MFSFPVLLSIVLAGLGVLMIFGLATSITGIVSCTCLVVSVGWLHLRSNEFFLLAARLALVVALLGPGAYSLDAQLFGWRRVEITRRTPKR